MSKRGKRLREFEKNNRTFNITEARQKRAEKYSHLESKNSGRDVLKEESQTPEKRKKRTKIVNTKRFIASVIIVMIIASVGMSAINIIKLTVQRNELQAQNADLIKFKEDLTSELEYINSAEYIEQQARKELKMIKENELLFIVDDQEDKE